MTRSTEILGLRPWVKLPSQWIEHGGLQQFRWLPGTGANNLAALIALAVIAHHAEADTGLAHLTWNELCTKTSLSRAKLAGGLDLLAGRSLVDREPQGRSTYRLKNYDPNAGWAQFPARGLYNNDVVEAFKHFSLRLPAELEAMKLYFLFASRRDRTTNMAMLSYQRIEQYSGVGHNNIRRALSVLSSHNLVHVYAFRSDANPYGVANGYRLAHLDTRQHMGTSGRGTEFLDVH